MSIFNSRSEWKSDYLQVRKYDFCKRYGYMIYLEKINLY